MQEKLVGQRSVVVHLRYQNLQDLQKEAGVSAREVVNVADREFEVGIIGVEP